MPIKIVPLAPEMSFKEFCDKHNITVEIKERNREMLKVARYRWYASAKCLLEIKQGVMLVCTHGNGNTPEEALANYANQLRGQLLIRNAYSDREEIQAPSNWREY